MERYIGLKVKYFSEIGPKRKQNQDNFYVQGRANWSSAKFISGKLTVHLEYPQIVSLFDGMGGEAEGKTASLLAASCMEILAHSLSESVTEKEVNHILDEYYENFMDRLDETMDDEYAVCGTTCVGAVFQRQQLIPFWMGDSRGYILRDGELIRLTKDHSLAQIEIDNGRMTEDEARQSSAWHTLTSYMGQYGEKITVGDMIKVYPGDRLLFCSDGITDMCSDEEVKRLLQQHGQKCIDILCSMAKRESDDNSTAILLDVEDDTVYVRYKEMKRRVRECLQYVLKNIK